MSLLEDVRKALLELDSDAQVHVKDDSHKHEGHAGYRAGEVTHIQLEVVSSIFETMSRIERHRAVNSAVSGCFDKGLHALSLSLFTPKEYKTYKDL